MTRILILLFISTAAFSQNENKWKSLEKIKLNDLTIERIESNVFFDHSSKGGLVITNNDNNSDTIFAGEFGNPPDFQNIKELELNNKKHLSVNWHFSGGQSVVSIYYIYSLSSDSFLEKVCDTHYSELGISRKDDHILITERYANIIAEKSELVFNIDSICYKLNGFDYSLYNIYDNPNYLNGKKISSGNYKKLFCVIND